MKKRDLLFVAVLVFAFGPVWGAAAGNRGQDGPLIRIKGSDTLVGVSVRWARGYQAGNPAVRMEVNGGGSGNGVSALINNHVDIAITSQPLSKREIRQLTLSAKAPPVSFAVGLDALSVLVHPDNPLNGISLRQLAEVYAKHGKIRNWTDLGITVPGCSNGKILKTSRKNKSGTYHFFRGSIFPKRRHFPADMESWDRSIDVVRRVSEEPCAIGYSGMAFVTQAVKPLCIVSSTNAKSNGPCVPPTATFTLNGHYPLARTLYMVTRGPPEGVIKGFLGWVMGSEGRDVLRKSGYVPTFQKEKKP